MSDLKSKMPDLNEITSMAGKLFKDVKKSITEIIAEYKTNHPATQAKDEVSAESKIEESKTKESKEQKKEESNNSDTA